LNNIICELLLCDEEIEIELLMSYDLNSKKKKTFQQFVSLKI